MGKWACLNLVWPKYDKADNTIVSPPTTSYLRLDLVNVVVGPLLFTKSRLFTKSSLAKEQNTKKGAGGYSLTADA